MEDELRQEMVRLMVQSLTGLGYRGSAEKLQEESGITLETSAITQLRDGVISGNWADVEISVNEIGISGEDLKFLELLENGQIIPALQVLRNELSPLHVCAGQLHLLSSLLMAKDPQDMKIQSGWDGAKGKSRKDLLNQLQKHIPPSLMIPDQRLASILTQFTNFQKKRCIYHDSKEYISLYRDHLCDRKYFPTETQKVLLEHTDEVWVVAFSNKGDYLASAGKDNKTILWNVEDWSPLHILTGHTNAPSFVTWSPNDKYILTTSSDKTIKLWNILTGNCEQTFTHLTSESSAVAWHPNSLQFISGGTEKQMVLWHISGSQEYTWPNRGQDMCVTHDGKLLIAVASKKISVYSLDSKSQTPEFVINEVSEITSVSVSRDRKVLVRLTNHELHLWDLEEREITKKYSTRKENEAKFVVRSCFGGCEESFVVSGSEESKVWIWNRESEIELEVLSGHS
ncbi:hypothetical protein HK096_002455, partial [Nowakowskiella sp. JEL0078]